MRERIRKLFTGMWNIPNVLTIIRLALIPVFIIVYYNGHPHQAAS